ncbi:AI-2E family transporter [Microbacterium sp. bgisy189]|uniref:AI-2E family transporter n=1 Tax=Microbacterium sp. bgisy189 TaxID=3413798 RepID=UPI003EBE1BC1
MGLFGSRPKIVKLDTTGPGSLPVHAPGKPWSLWSDGMGVLATRSLQLIIVLAVAAVVVLGVREVTVVTIPLILALIIACAFAPLMGWLRRHGFAPLPATLVCLLAALTVLGLIGWLITWQVRDQWDDLSSKAQDGFNGLMAWIATLPVSIDQEQIDEWIAAATDFVTSAQFGSGALAGVSAVATFLTGLILMIVTLFFFLKDGPRMWEFLLRPFEGAAYRRAARVGDTVVTTFGNYVRGTASIAAVDAIGILIGLLILQVPLAVPLAVLVFVGAFVPIVGATVAGALAALVALVTNGWVVALIVVGVIVLVQQLEGNLLQPFLMGQSMKLHAFVILIALTVGTVLGGIVGAIISVPITAVAWGVIKVWDGPRTPARWARPKNRATEIAAEG